MAHASGKYSKAISDRSGMEFSYKEMVKEWNGSMVHKSEFEAGRPDRLEPITVFVGGAGFFEYEDSMQPSTSKKQPLVVSSIGIVSVSVS